MTNQTVGDLSGFNFIENPFQEGTHIFESWSGTFVCESPSSGDRFKHQVVVREATEMEERFHTKTIKEL